MNTPEFTANIKRAVSLLREAQAIITSAPLDYYLQKLVEHSEALLTKFAPIKAGQRARITKEVNVGWGDCDEMLAVGAVGQVMNVDYRLGHFVCDFCPVEQFYVRDGKRVQSHTKHTYCLRAEHLEPE